MFLTLQIAGVCDVPEEEGISGVIFYYQIDDKYNQQCESKCNSMSDYLIS
jgi:hypothetical protein